MKPTHKAGISPSNLYLRRGNLTRLKAHMRRLSLLTAYFIQAMELLTQLLDEGPLEPQSFRMRKATRLEQTLRTYLSSLTSVNNLENALLLDQDTSSSPAIKPKQKIG